MAEEILQNDRLLINIDPDTALASVHLKGEDLAWSFEPSLDADVVVRHGTTEISAHLREARHKRVRRFRTAADERVCLFYEGLPGNTGVLISYCLPESGPTLRIEAEALPSGTVSRIAELRYPGPVAWRSSAPSHTLWPNAAGMLLPNNHPTAVTPNGEGIAERLAFTRSLYQPWWGVVGDRGAYAAIAETPFDFAFDIRHPAGGPTTTRPIWMASHGHLAYPRAIRYSFFGTADHVTLAKTYRAYAKSIGRWVSLEEKFDRNPRAKGLIGATIFPVPICRHAVLPRRQMHRVTSFERRTEQIRRLKALGREKVYLHVDGWGFRGYDNQHPDVFPPCPEAGGWDGLITMSQAADERGYLFGLHDQYRDYFLDGPLFCESRAVKDASGTLPQWALWDGGPQTVLCAKESLANIRRNFSELLGRGVKLTASYLDVFAIVPMDECFDPAHPMTREDCYRWRAAGLDYVRSLGLAISSEEPVDCFVPHLDFAHWADYPRHGFMKGDYLGIPIPIHTLVYHDALLLPAVFDYGATPENRARAFLEGLARVEIPYGSIEWDSPERFRHVDLLAGLHEVWGTAELTNHKLLEPEGLVQEFEYPDGAVAIDLRELRYRIDGGPLATAGWQDVEL